MTDDEANRRDPIYVALVTTTPERSADDWLNRVGETLDSQRVIDLLGFTAEQLRAEDRTGSVLALSGPDGMRYPVWQFDPNASPPAVRPITLQIAMTFRQALGETPPWLIASWAASPQPELDDRTPADWIADTEEDELVLLAAQRAAHLELA